MCLLVRKEIKVLVKKCYKKMKLISNGTLTTPYQGYSCRYDGLMIPGVDFPKKIIKKDAIIESGYIHAYTYTDKDFSTNTIGMGNTEITSDLSIHDVVYLKSYAFWAEATGYRYDLVCRALYIPQLDLTNRRNIRVSMLENRYNKTRLIKEFKPLEKILGDY